MLYLYAGSKFVHIKLLALLTVALFTATMTMNSAYADPTDGELFYTTFVTQAGMRVFSIEYDYDGANTFQLMNDTPICNTPGADGISQNPQNADLLLVGNQGPNISTCSKSTGIVVTTTSNGPSIFHLEVTSPNSVYGNGIAGQPVLFTINGDGSVNPGQPVAMAGQDGALTQIISTPGQTFYSGGAIFGTIDFANPTSATTARLTSSVPGNGGHGGIYDPFTDTIVTFGGSTVNQWDNAGNFLATKSFPGANFDQGTVDGQGHLFIASNPNLFFLDYSSDGKIDTATHFNALSFVRNSLDDVAPLVGEGSTDPCMNAPGSPECCEAKPTDPSCTEIEVGGEFLPIETTSLLLAAASSPAAWLTSLTIVALGIGAYVFTRNSNNMRNIKVILRDYLDRL